MIGVLLFRILLLPLAFPVVIFLASLNCSLNSLLVKVTIRSGGVSSLILFHFGAVLETAFRFAAVFFDSVVTTFGFVMFIFGLVGSCLLFCELIVVVGTIIGRYLTYSYGISRGNCDFNLEFGKLISACLGH